MSIKRILTVSAITLGVVASNVSMLSSQAAADGWNGRHNRQGYARHNYARPYQAPVYGYNHGYRSSRDKTGERIAKGVIIGVGAAILGAILSDAARADRHRFDRYKD
jgi:hypothetical protein